MKWLFQRNGSHIEFPSKEPVEYRGIREPHVAVASDRMNGDKLDSSHHDDKSSRQCNVDESSVRIIDGGMRNVVPGLRSKKDTE